MGVCLQPYSHGRSTGVLSSIREPEYPHQRVQQTGADVYELIGKYQITHVSATPTFYRLLLPFEHAYESVIRVTLGGEV